MALAATDEVWLRVYDADNKTLYLGTMKPGERFEVPAGARDPKINVGRPDKLQVTINGAAMPALDDGRAPDQGRAGQRRGGRGPRSRAAPAATDDPTGAAPTAAIRTRRAAERAPRTRDVRGRGDRSFARRNETQRANTDAAPAPQRLAKDRVGLATSGRCR